MDPRKLEQMMQQMGIDMTELDATEVRITTESGEVLVFDTPEVTRMDAQGQETYQIVGSPESEEADATAPAASEAIPDADVDLVVERAGVEEGQARDALEAADGDLAAAIERLS